ncbi:hypothetical protein [uncultured Faecalibaculum sp.]|nr:hypothetical protein [uncultured Faecalibaculum sp.]
MNADAVTTAHDSIIRRGFPSMVCGGLAGGWLAAGSDRSDR